MFVLTPKPQSTTASTATTTSSSPSLSARPPAPATASALAPSSGLAERMDRPEEADYKWAQDSYSSLQRTADTWTFFTLFRAQLFLLDQKWSYIGAWALGGGGGVRGGGGMAAQPGPSLHLSLPAGPNAALR